MKKDKQQQETKLSKQELERRIKSNRELLQSGGILRDYDNNEVLYPLNLTLLDVLNRMKEIAKSQL